MANWLATIVAVAGSIKDIPLFNQIAVLPIIKHNPVGDIHKQAIPREAQSGDGRGIAKLKPKTMRRNFSTTLSRTMREYKAGTSKLRTGQRFTRAALSRKGELLRM